MSQLTTARAGKGSANGKTKQMCSRVLVFGVSVPWSCDLLWQENCIIGVPETNNR